MKFTKNYPDYDVEVVHCTYVTQEKIVIKKTMFYLKYEKKSKNNLGLIYFRKKRGKMYDYIQSPIRSLDGLIGNKLATINSALQQLWTYTLSNNLVHIQFHQNFFDDPAQGGNIMTL